MNIQPFKPYGHQTINQDHCNATVYDRFRIDVIGHQCTNKKVVDIEGVGFCKLHAKRYRP